MKTIFVSIASFIDPDFSNTIKDCIDKAKYPDRVRIGLFLQDEREVFESYSHPNVDKLTCLPDIAEGCGWSRNRIMQQLYNNEDYFLLVDSHSRFEKDWDVKYTQLLDNAPSKCVLSSFPRHFEFDEDYETYSIRDKSTIYVPNEIPFVGNFKGPHKQKIATKQYERVMNISGGNTFGPGSIVEALTIKDFKYYGHQEQEIYSLLLYKNGYDIYAVKDNLIWHKYFVHGKDNYRQVYVEKKGKIDFWPDLKEYGSNLRSHSSWLDEYNIYCKSL